MNPLVCAASTFNNQLVQGRQDRSQAAPELLGDTVVPRVGLVCPSIKGGSVVAQNQLIRGAAVSLQAANQRSHSSAGSFPWDTGRNPNNVGASHAVPSGMTAHEMPAPCKPCCTQLSNGRPHAAFALHDRHYFSCKQALQASPARKPCSLCALMTYAFLCCNQP
jgi:hypothetical protein